MKNHIVNVALVGCGRISEKHLTNIFKLQDQICLKAICDNDNEKLNKTNKFISELQLSDLNQSRKIRNFNDYDNLLNEISIGKIDIDLIVLCTPSGFHAQQSIKAGNLGINVCTEKPLATSLKDGYEICNCFKESKAKLFIVLQNRLNPTVRLVKKQIENGRFGKLFLISSNVFWQRPQSYYDQDSWRGTNKLDGGALLNQSCHYVDLISYLSNCKVKKVSAFCNTLNRKIEMEDTAVMNFEFEKGILGNLSSTMLTYPKNLEGSITILGEKGTVKIGGIALNKIEKWMFEEQSDEDNLLDEVNYEVDSVYGSGHYYFYQKILDTLINGKENLFSLEEGLVNLKLIMAAYESSNENIVSFINPS